MLHSYRHILLILVSLLALTGCHTQKSTDRPISEIPELPASKANTAELFEQMTATYGEWTDLYAPVTLSLVAPKSFSVSGRATMVRDKEIYISLRMLGMELGVIYINETKVYAVDKIHKQYIEEDLSRLLAGVDITISDVQNILLGRITNFGKGTITAEDADDFTFLSADDKWILTPVNQIKGAELNYIASKTEPPVLMDISVRIPGKGVLDCGYTDFTDTPAGATAAMLTMLAPMDKTEASASIEWNLKDAKWNEGRKANFKTPSSSYKRIDAQALIKSLGNI